MFPPGFAHVFVVYPWMVSELAPGDGCQLSEDLDIVSVEQRHMFMTYFNIDNHIYNMISYIQNLG